MSTYACPHYDGTADRCTRLDCPCRIGQPGCVAFGKVVLLDDVPPPRRRRRRSPPQDTPPAGLPG